MRLGKYRHRFERTSYWDVILVLSVLLSVGLLFWTWGLFSIVPTLPHYPSHGTGTFSAHWAANGAPIDQPLTLFSAIHFLIFVWLFVQFLTIRGPSGGRMLPERTSLGAGFILIVGLGMVTDDLIDIVSGRYSLEKWQGTVFAPDWLFIPESVDLYGDPEARYWIRIGNRDVFLADADTLQVDGRNFHLWGVDALQTEQLCSTESKRRIRCGYRAREALLELMTSMPPSRISCFYPDQAFYGHTISCRVGERDVGHWLVRHGHAFPDWAGRHRYQDAVQDAAAKRRGAWGTTFLHPREWRAARCNRVAGVCRKDYEAD